MAFPNTGVRIDSTHKHMLGKADYTCLNTRGTGWVGVALKHVTNTSHPITASGLDGIENDNKEGT